MENKIAQQVPNLFTLLNLLCGCLSITYAFKGSLEASAIFIFVGALFDFADGLAARILKAYSDTGKQLDSLADLVSFGLAPGVILFVLLENTGSNIWTTSIALSFLPFLVTLSSAVRLAKFNVDERQTRMFIGLPTPASAMFIGSLVFLVNDKDLFFSELVNNVYFILSVVFLLSYLLNSRIPLFSLKISSMKWKENRIQYIFIFFSTVLLIFLSFKAIALIIILYVILSLTSQQHFS
jgi:CDP-diacylglycerol---serine O-phosphatidyltransferase